MKEIFFYCRIVVCGLLQGHVVVRFGLFQFGLIVRGDVIAIAAVSGAQKRAFRRLADMYAPPDAVTL